MDRSAQSQPVVNACRVITEAEPSAPEGSDLFLRYVLPDQSHDAINLKVWRGTPWITDAFSGPISEPRDGEMREWCESRFGPQAWPFGEEPRSGRWFRGTATICGWTWFGFSTGAEMREFEAAWPAPIHQHREGGRG